jgi:hypothetical protein
METRFDYTPELGVVAPGTVVALGSGSFRVLADPSYGGPFVIEVEVAAADAQDPWAIDDPTLVRFASTLGTLEIREQTVLVDGALATGAALAPRGSTSLVLSRDKAGATRLAARAGAGGQGAVWFSEVHAVSVFGDTPTVDVFFAPSVASVAFRWCAVEPRQMPVWAGWWVPVEGSLAVPGLERRFDYVPGSFWANAQVDATAADAFVVASVDPTTARAKFVLSVDINGGSTSGAVLDVREGTTESGTSFGIETVDIEGLVGEMFAVVDGHRQSVGVRFTRASALSIVLASDGSTTHLSVREASAASSASVTSASVTSVVATGGSRRLTVTVGASVARATLLWPIAATAAPSGIDWAGWWSHVPVLEGPGPGVVTWDAALDGARYAPACAESGALPWSAEYSAKRIGEVRDAGMSIGAGDGYVVWDGSALVVVAEPRGPRGTTGGKGPVGSRGRTGPTSTERGHAGASGDRGPRGYEGARGERGQDGDTGTDGDKGTDAKGATGPRGELGATGAQGDHGPTGPTGGPTGDKGSTGRDGEAGPRGADGAQGPDGPPGARAANGDSGDPGPTGPRGERGATGAAGTEVGPTGPPGYAGHAGDGGKPGVPAFTGRYASVARIPPCNVDGVVAAGSTATLAFSAPLASRTLAVSASTGVVLAAMRPYAATVGNYTDEIDTSANAAFFATGTGVPLVVTYTLDAPVLVCGYELSTSDAVHKWTVELDGVVRDDRTEEMHALNSRDFVRVAILPVSCIVFKLTIVSCAANAGVRLLIDHLGAP